MILVRQFARLPDELADGDQAGGGHASEQDDEHAAHVVEAELVGRVGARLGVLLQTPGGAESQWAGRHGRGRKKTLTEKKRMGRRQAVKRAWQAMLHNTEYA